MAKKATDEIYSVINDRHRALHYTLSKYPTGSNLLDVGCGTGQLAIEAAEKGYQSLGIDFAHEMIIANRNAKEKSTSGTFEVNTVFNYQPKNKFELKRWDTNDFKQHLST